MSDGVWRHYSLVLLFGIASIPRPLSFLFSSQIEGLFQNPGTIYTDVAKKTHQWLALLWISKKPNTNDTSKHLFFLSQIGCCVKYTLQKNQCHLSWARAVFSVNLCDKNKSHKDKFQKLKSHGRFQFSVKIY